MRIEKVTIQNLRCIEEACLPLLPGANLLYGGNASGKTSVLEALYMLGTGRSFRTHHAHSAIRHDAHTLTLSSRLITEKNLSIDLGVQRNTEGHFSAHIAGNNIRTTSELASQMPIQLISPDSINLISHGPEARRGFIDAGLFYLNPGFHRHWRAYKKYLKQRNSWLKLHSGQPAELTAWEHGMAQSGEQVSLLRRQYVDRFAPVFQEYAQTLVNDSPIRLELARGWNEKISLQDSLRSNREADQAVGHTRQGPHRADLGIFLDGRKAQEVASGGQEKLLVCAMRFAQARMLQQRTGIHSVFLVDDLPSELDKTRLAPSLRALQKLGSQCLFTALDAADFDAAIGLIGQPSRHRWATMFHVEQGRVTLMP